MHAPGTPGPQPPSDPNARQIATASSLALAAVLLTRIPVARPSAFDFDEVGYLIMVARGWFPMHHTLFLAAAHGLGTLLGDPYRGFLALDMLTSALALVAAWWWLRALVPTATAAAATLVLAASPLFWSYGAMAGNYTAIIAVGSFLLGIAYRGWTQPRSWHPYAAAIALALGAGYRQDIGTFWLPVLAVILWTHRWVASTAAVLTFTWISLAWFVPMLIDAGGWHQYRQASAEFAHKAGYLNSIWNLGPIDATLRYAAKATAALVLTLGPGLLFLPRGLQRLTHRPNGPALAALMALAAAPALGMHLLIHFGVPGYAFHYIPALLALTALGIGRRPSTETAQTDQAPTRLALLAVGLALAFLVYPTNYERPGLRGDFDLAFARYTRAGLQTRPPLKDPNAWRTANSQVLPGGHRAAHSRRSLAELLD